MFPTSFAIFFMSGGASHYQRLYAHLGTAPYRGGKWQPRISEAALQSALGQDEVKLG